MWWKENKHKERKEKTHDKKKVKTRKEKKNRKKYIFKKNEEDIKKKKENKDGRGFEISEAFIAGKVIQTNLFKTPVKKITYKKLQKTYSGCLRDGRLSEQ